LRRGAASACLFNAAAYLVLRRPSPPSARLEDNPPVGIVYLCCDDLDPEALASLARLRYRGRLHLIVHDDSPTPEGRAAVYAAVARLAPRGRCGVRVPRRPRREGGKAGAVNGVLEQTALSDGKTSRGARERSVMLRACSNCSLFCSA